MIDAFFHRGLMLASFDEHLMHRRIMQEAFTRPRLTGYVGQVAPCVRAAVPAWPTGPSVRIYPLLKNLTLDIATDVFMGGRGRTRALLSTRRSFPPFARRVPLCEFHPGHQVPRRRAWAARVEDYFSRHLPAARAGETDDLFAALCQATTEDGERFSDEDVINHMIFLMMAAHDTSTITTTAVTYFLAKHPEWQEKAAAEARSFGDDSPDIDELEQMTVPRSDPQRSLRLLAPVPLVMRKTVRDVAIDGYHIPVKPCAQSHRRKSLRPQNMERPGPFRSVALR